MTLQNILGLFALTIVTFCVPQIWSLSGKNVCTKIETYEISVTKTAQRPYVIREMVWCMQVPPRCPKIRTAYRIQTVFENVTKTRLVSECCEGYSEMDDKCTPQCGGEFDGCGSRGQCVAPDICKCDPGFHGNTCNQGYDLTTTMQPSTMESTTKTSKYPTYDHEDRYNEFDNDITSDLSHIVVPIMNTTKQSTRQQSTTTTTQVPKYTTVRTISTEETVKSKNKQKSNDKKENDKFKKFKITTQVPNIENVTEISLLPSTIQNITEVTLLSTTENTTYISVLLPVENTTELPKFEKITDISLLSTIENTTDPLLPTSTETTMENPSIVVKENSQISATMGKIGTQQSDDSSLLLTINNETLVHNQHLSFGIDLISAIILIIGASLSIILIALLMVLACHRNKVKPAQQCSPQQCTSVIHSQLPPTPRDASPPPSSAMFTPNNNVVILQHVTMATTNNTFKPAAQQPTISPALREALEAHYDHPPSTFRIDPNIGQRLSGHDLIPPSADNNNASLSELWDAVVASSSNNIEDEHLYDEIPCWRTRQPPDSTAGHHMVTKC